MNKFAQGLIACASVGLVLFAAAGCKKLPPPTPISELNPQQMHGHDVYQANCAQCHNDRTSQPLNGQSLRGVFKKEYLESGAPANDERVIDTILYGRALMPAMGSRMTPQEREDLLAYLHTL